MAYSTSSQTNALEWQSFPQPGEITAAMAVSSDELLLFQGSSYRSLNIQTGTVSQEESRWFGLPESWAGALTAATSWDANSAILLNGLAYVIYDYASQQNVAVGRLDEWPGYSFQGPNAVNAALAIGGGQIQFLTQRGTLLYDQSSQQFLSNSQVQTTATTTNNIAPRPIASQPEANQNQSHSTKISGSDSQFS